MVEDKLDVPMFVLQGFTTNHATTANVISRSRVRATSVCVRAVRKHTVLEDILDVLIKTVSTW